MIADSIDDDCENDVIALSRDESESEAVTCNFKNVDSNRDCEENVESNESANVMYCVKLRAVDVDFDVVDVEDGVAQLLGPRKGDLEAELGSRPPDSTLFFEFWISLLWHCMSRDFWRSLHIWTGLIWHRKPPDLQCLKLPLLTMIMH